MFERLLEKLAFSREDALVLVGDYIERGPENLPLLRRIMALSKSPNVFALMGNCDTLYEDILRRAHHPDILRYMDWQRKSLLNEMCAEIGFPIGPETNESLMRLRLREAFALEIDFLRSLPHIIESEELIFVHGGLRPGPLEEQDAEYCMTVRGFLEQAPAFEKYVVVGHWPTINYAQLRGGILDHSAYLDVVRHIVSLDGGNGVKASGQLNAMVYEKGKISFASADDLPVISLPHTQEASKDPFSIVWTYSDVEILRREAARSYVRHIRSGRELWLPNDVLHNVKGSQASSADYTDYFLPVEAGEAASLLQDGDPCLLKHKGVIGWYSK